MNDEYAIHYTLIEGSDNGREENYCLLFDKKCADVNELSFEEIVRLKDFLVAYVNKKGGENGSN